MSYVDFFCLPLQEDGLEKYKPAAELFAAVMKDYGLVRYCEAIADNVPRGEVTDFFRAVAAKEGETVIAAYAVWPDKETRDQAWEKGMKDPRLGDMTPDAMPFDGKRMFWGGFVPFVEVER